MIYFSTRAKARNFAKGQKKVIDLGSDMATHRSRWAIRVGNAGL